MKSLKTIQIIAKILSILSLIGFICSIVGAACSLTGLSVLCAIREDSELWQSIAGKFNLTKVELNAARCSCIEGFFASAQGILLCAFSKEFFKRELAVGTPFDKGLCGGMLRLGILHLAVPIGTMAVVSIFYAAFSVPYDGGSYAEFSVGIIYLLLALICSYGAEIRSSANGDRGNFNDNPDNNFGGFNGNSGGDFDASADNNGDNGKTSSDRFDDFHL